MILRHKNNTIFLVQYLFKKQELTIDYTFLFTSKRMKLWVYLGLVLVSSK